MKWNRDLSTKIAFKIFLPLAIDYRIYHVILILYMINGKEMSSRNLFVFCVPIYEKVTFKTFLGTDCCIFDIQNQRFGSNTISLVSESVVSTVRQ